MTTATRDYYKTIDEFENGGEEWNPAEVVDLPEIGPAVPRRCVDCDRPAYYDTTDEWYHHAVDPATGCFLIGSEPERDTDTAHPLVTR